MTIEFPPDVEAFILGEIATGRYSTPEEVLRAAFEVWGNHELRLEIQKGIDDLEAGRYEDYDEKSLHEFIETIRAERLGPRP